MNKRDLEAVGERALEPVRDLAYAELRRRADEGVVATDEFDENGQVLSIEIQYFLDGRDRDCNLSAVRVMACVSSGGWRDFVPATVSFIKAPDGAFIGE